MRLLFDQNLAAGLVRRVADLFPDSTHVRHVALDRASDAEVWTYAAEHGYAIVSKDADFHQHHGELVRFGDSEDASLLIID